MVITEGVFGMSGSQGKLKEIVALKEKFNFRLFVDDAHGFGTMGKTGAGTGEEQNCMDGIDHFAQRQLITITSCANYGGSENDACFLVVQKKLVISPKIIKPSKAGTPWQAIEAIPEGADSSVKRPPTPTKQKGKE